MNMNFFGNRKNWTVESKASLGSDKKEHPREHKHRTIDIYLKNGGLPVISPAGRAKRFEKCVNDKYKR